MTESLPMCTCVYRSDKSRDVPIAGEGVQVGGSCAGEELKEEQLLNQVGSLKETVEIYIHYDNS